MRATFYASVMTFTNFQARAARQSMEHILTINRVYLGLCELGFDSF